MTVISPTALATQYTAPASGTSSAILGKDDFLKLLLAQLRYQDPLNPLEGTEFAAQLAQFSSVEQLANINSNLTQNLDATNILSQAIGNALSASMIGKDVKATTDSLQYSGSGEVQFGYSLGQAAAQVTVRITDETGATIRTLEADGLAQGDNALTWDGTDNRGNPVAQGEYTLVIDAVDGAGSSIAAEGFLVGEVTAIRFKAGGTVFVVNGMEIPVSEVLEILNGRHDV